MVKRAYARNGLLVKSAYARTIIARPRDLMRRSSASSSALKYYFCFGDDFSRRYQLIIPERSPKIKKTMNTSLTVPVMYPWKVPLAYEMK